MAAATPTPEAVKDMDGAEMGGDGSKAVTKVDEEPPIKSALTSEENVADLLLFNILQTPNDADG